MTSIPFDLARIRPDEGTPCTIYFSPENLLRAPTKVEIAERGEPTEEQLASGVEPLGKLIWWLRAELGRDSKRLSDLALVRRSGGKGRKKGEMSIRAGTIAHERIILSTVRVDGLETGGQPVARVTAEVLDRLPDWLLNQVLLQINEMSGADEDEEGN
jgi:hypothetical protein